MGSEVDHIGEVRRIPSAEARVFLRKHELLGNAGLGVWHWGLFERGQLSSVVSYGTASFSFHRGFVSKIALASGCTIIQLCRGAATSHSHKHASSFLIAKANKLMYKWKGPLLIVAFANPQLGEVGTIYQACNAIYTGFTVPRGQGNYVVNGKNMSGWVVRKKFGTRSMAKLQRIDPEVTMTALLPKHRYIFFACSNLKKKELTKLFSSYILPYPKR